jgi:tetratricopeptide (TPR) repeat protein
MLSEKRPMTKNRLAILFCCATICSWALAGEAPGDRPGEEELDIIVRFDGKPVPPTKITQGNYLEVKGKKGGEVKVKAFEVKEIRRANAESYASALQAMEVEKYRVAALLFIRMMESLPDQKWAIEYGNYGIGNALFLNGDYGGFTGRSGTKYAAASVYFKKALEANEKSRFLPDIMAKLPVCYAEEEKFDQATAALAEAEKKIKDYGREVFTTFNTREPEKRAMAALAMGDSRVAERMAEKGKGDWQAAKDKWIIARTRCFDYPQMLGEAVDGLLRTLLTMKDYNTASSEAESIISKFKNSGDVKQLPLLPSAYFALGRAYLQQAQEYDGKNQLQQAREFYAKARWAFTGVIAQFFDNEEYVTQAYYWAGVCYEKLKDLETDAMDKAVRQWKVIVSNYPKSGFRDLAQQSIEKASKKDEPKKDDPKKTKPKKDEAKKEEPAKEVAPPAKK